MIPNGVDAVAAVIIVVFTRGWLSYEQVAQRNRHRLLHKEVRDPISVASHSSPATMAPDDSEATRSDLYKVVDMVSEKTPLGQLGE